MPEREEDKHDRFRRIAENRTNKILDMLRLLGNCANTNNYTYDAKEVARIFAAIDTAVEDAKQKFALPTKEKERFRL